MITVAEIQFDCPCCRKRFPSTTSTFRNILGPTTTDFFAMAAGEQYIHHGVHTCPSCGYTFEGDDPGQVNEEVRLFVREKITPLLPGGDIPSWRRYELLATIDEALGGDFYSLAMYYLQAAWCCYDLKMPVEEARFRRKAIEFFRKAWRPRTMDWELIYLVPYLVAEQYRRIGDLRKAREWYDRVINLEEEHPDRKLFVSLALQQKSEPKELMGEIMHP